MIKILLYKNNVDVTENVPKYMIGIFYLFLFSTKSKK